MKAKKSPKQGKKIPKKRQKTSISFSEETAKMLLYLREKTDADTESEVHRNAARVHYRIVQACLAGKPVTIGGETIHPLAFFILS